MIASISRSEVKGEIIAPPSKSYTIRSLFCAALAKGESIIRHPLLSDDTQAAFNVVQNIGVNLTQDGEAWLVRGGSYRNKQQELYCGDSAATLRFMTAICSAIPGTWKLTAGSSLVKRPVRPLIEALKQLGVECSARGDFPPVMIKGGAIKGGIVRLPGDISSQFISALLLLAPLTREGLTIELTTPPRSLPYILMTLSCMHKYGIDIYSARNVKTIKIARQDYKPIRFTVEGDWSSASYFLALGAMAGEVKVKNLRTNSLQGDRKILSLLYDMGATIEQQRDMIKVSKAHLRGMNTDLSQCIDLLPTISVLAASARGISKLSGIKRGRIKESDRVAAIKQGLQKMGVEAVVEEDQLTIYGAVPRGATIDSKNDHRIAMAFSLLGCLAGDTLIQGAESISKTFPEYWSLLKNIGAKVEING